MRAVAYMKSLSCLENVHLEKAEHDIGIGEDGEYGNLGYFEDTSTFSIQPDTIKQRFKCSEKYPDDHDFDNNKYAD